MCHRPPILYRSICYTPLPACRTSQCCGYVHLLDTRFHTPVLMKTRELLVLLHSIRVSVMGEGLIVSQTSCVTVLSAPVHASAAVWAIVRFNQRLISANGTLRKAQAISSCRFPLSMSHLHSVHGGDVVYAKLDSANNPSIRIERRIHKLCGQCVIYIFQANKLLVIRTRLQFILHCGPPHNLYRSASSRVTKKWMPGAHSFHLFVSKSCTGLTASPTRYTKSLSCPLLASLISFPSLS